MPIRRIPEYGMFPKKNGTKRTPAGRGPGFYGTPMSRPTAERAASVGAKVTRTAKPAAQRRATGNLTMSQIAGMGGVGRMMPRRPTAQRSVSNTMGALAAQGMMSRVPPQKRQTTIKRPVPNPGLRQVLRRRGIR